MQPDLAFALELADLADAITLARFRAADLRVETKPDLTPVSEADHAVEEAVRGRVASERPGEGVLGEELGDDGTARRWIVDPIDGTRNYVRGVPVWATLLSFEDESGPAAAVVSAPALRRRWWAARGEGAWSDSGRLKVSGVGRLADAVCSTTGLPAPAGVWHDRNFGDFWQHMLVAEGCIDFTAEPKLRIWDWSAVRFVVEEAGGRCTDLHGAPPADGSSFVASNGVLHDEALAALRAQ
jgi:histidinol-phosphatase